MPRLPLFAGALVAGLAVLSGLALAGDPAPTPAPAPTAGLVEYTLDNTKGALYVQVFKDPTTLAASLSHEHVIVATGWKGTVSWDPSNVATCKVSITVPTSGLVNDEEAWRKRVGYTSSLSDGERADVKEHMLDDGQLDAAKYPNLTFTSSGCEQATHGVKVSGQMNIHGVGKTVSPTLAVNADGKFFNAKGSFSMNHTDFGMQPFSALLGQLKNKNEMIFTIDVKGTAK